MGYPGTALPYPPVPPTLECPDAFEPDNYPWQATTVVVNGAPQSHTFDRAQDTDWVTFNAITGTTYLMKTANPTNGAQTELLLYNSAGALLAGAIPNGDGTASITWTAPQNDGVKLRIHSPQWAPFGCGVSYTIQVTTVSP